MTDKPILERKNTDKVVSSECWGIKSLFEPITASNNSTDKLEMTD